MHLYNGRIQRDSFDTHAHDLRALQLFERPIEYAAPGPAVQARTLNFEAFTLKISERNLGRAGVWLGILNGHQCLQFAQAQ